MNVLHPASPTDLSSEPDTFPPPWASAWGEDRYGRYAELQVGLAVQRFRWIVPGTFEMGSPETEAERRDDETRHEVTLTRGYWLGDTAVTQGLWKALMGSNPSRFEGDDRLPVETVSWEDAQDFIDRLNERVEGLGARLPSEAQWEYACRAGTQTPFSFGETITPEEVNYNGNHPYGKGRKGLYRENPVPVGSLPANGWGLYEMHGNVWEWCSDWYGDYGSGALVDPEGPSEGSRRVLRGGSWIRSAVGARSARRFAYDPGFRYDYFGFRLAPGRKGAGPAEQGGREVSRGTRETGDAARERAASVVTVHVVAEPDGGFMVSAISGTEVIDTLVSPSHWNLIHELLASAEVQRGRRKSASIAQVSRYLITDRLRRLPSGADWRLSVNQATGAFPWEIVLPHDENELPPAAVAPVVRTVHARSKSPRPPGVFGKGGLIVVGASSTGNSGSKIDARGLREAQRLSKYVGEILKLLAGSAAAMGRLYERSHRIVHLTGEGILQDVGSVRPRAGLFLGVNSLVPNPPNVQPTIVSSLEFDAFDNPPELVVVNASWKLRVFSEGDDRDQAVVETSPGQLPPSDEFARFAALMATDLLSVGVRCVLVAGRPMKERSALLFLETFYGALQDAHDFGNAVLRARRACYDADPSDLAWGAFQAWGDARWR